MLTESEIDWLRRRNMTPSHYCGRCMKYALCCTPQFNHCPIKNSDWQDAAEFEARVAVKLTNVFQHINDYWINLPCDACPQEGKCDMDCNDNILKWARLQVEEEMNADSE